MDTIKNLCTDEKDETYTEELQYKKYHRLPKYCLVVYSLGTWLKTRLDEIQWSKFNKQNSKNLGLFTAIIRQTVRQAVKDPTSWTLNSLPKETKVPHYAYRGLNLSVQNF